MGVLSDYFVADPTAVTQLDSDQLSLVQPRIDAKGFGMIPLEAVAKRLGVTAFEPGPPEVHGPDYEGFVLPLTPALVAALAKLSPEAVAAHAEAVAPIPELEWTPGEVTRVLDGLAKLAAGAGSARVYLWTCV